MNRRGSQAGRPGVAAAALPSLAGVVFSRDRALQLRALLDSLDRHCLDPAALQVLHVLCTGSTPHLAEQYSVLESEWRGRVPVVFHREQDFRRDLLRVLGLRDQRVRRELATRFPPRLQRLVSRRLLPLPRVRAPWDYLLFLVDDNLFVRPFTLGAVVNTLAQRPRAIGFSLRLGRNTTYCYARDFPQRLPDFLPAGPGLLAFEWPGEEGDFGYPLEVSSSVYPRDVIAGLLAALPYTNPNTLEVALSGVARPLREKRPQLCCPETSVAFCNPANRVQDTILNRAGESEDLAAAALARRFDEGWRIDVAALDGFVPDGCHCESPLRFVPPSAGDGLEPTP